MQQSLSGSTLPGWRWRQAKIIANVFLKVFRRLSP